MARLPPPPVPQGCKRCTSVAWCAECYRSVERASTEAQLREWLRMWDKNGSGPPSARQSQPEAE